MLFFCELYVIRDEQALLGRTARHPRSWASTTYNYSRSWASTSYNYNYQLPAGWCSSNVLGAATKAVWQMGASTCTEHAQQKQTSE